MQQAKVCCIFFHAFGKRQGMQENWYAQKHKNWLFKKYQMSV